MSLLLIYGWQGLNAAIPWRAEIRAGSRLDLGNGATAVPPVGWQLESGLLVGQGSTSAASVNTVLVKGGATIEFRGVAFAGTAAEFLNQVSRSEADGKVGLATASQGTVVASSGLVGVSQAKSGPSGDQLDVGFKMATGSAAVVAAAPALLVRIQTGPGQFEQYRDTVAALLASIHPEVTR